MDAIAFYIFYPLNWLITLLPLRILYIFADLLFLLIYYFPGYRRKVVTTNLKNAFPEKSTEEIARIGKSYFRHLADVFIETLALTHLGRKEHLRRCPVENPELLDDLYNKGKDIIAIVSHYSNWEMMSNLPLFCKYKCISIYRPLKNKSFDRFLIKQRSKYNMVLTPMSMVIREVVRYRKEGTRTLSSVLADQTPAKEEIAFWTTFLNQDTPVYLGAGKIASKYDMAMVFLKQTKVRRGYYTVKAELLFESCSGISDKELTESHVKHLEAIIREKPEYWIWSHRRWKHRREEANG